MESMERAHTQMTSITWRVRFVALSKKMEIVYLKQAPRWYTE